MVNLHDPRTLGLLVLTSKQARPRPLVDLKSTHLSHLLPSTLSRATPTPKHTFTIMSWMDSWSRPSKHQSVPAPFYLLPGGENTPYCHSCGRVINSRRKGPPSTKDDAEKSPIRYCSASCRARKPGKVDREIEGVFLRFLQGEEKLLPLDEGSRRTPKSKKGSSGKRAKGHQGLLISCDDVEKLVFGQTDGGAMAGSGSGSEDDHEDESGGESGVATGAVPGATLSEPRGMARNPGDLVDPIDEDTPYIDGDVLARMSIRSGTRIRPPQSISEVNGSVGGEKGRAERIGETDEMLEKRRRGQRKARQREMVRCAARRAVVFGLVDGERQGEDRRKCEAVMNGKVVEPSFAKGSWSIRWRE